MTPSMSGQHPVEDDHVVRPALRPGRAPVTPSGATSTTWRSAVRTRRMSAAIFGFVFDHAGSASPAFCGRDRGRVEVPTACL